MLPKVANHILHHTARAAAAVQNQTGHTIRNVLQLQSSSNPSTGLTPWNGTTSSSWGNGGAGPGGAKYQSSSRFYSGYQGSGRAVTQANTVAGQDGDLSQGDEEELRPRRPAVRSSGKGRGRSHSLSVTGQERRERGEALGVLRIVQMHVRRKHTFLIQAAETSESGEPLSALNVTPAQTPARVISRRNSTASAVAPSYELHLDLPPPPSSLQSPPKPTRPLSPVESVSALSSETTSEPLSSGSESGIDVKALAHAGSAGDYAAVLKLVQNMREKETGLTQKDFNAALSALWRARRIGQPLHYIVNTYNDMLARSIAPSFWTYRIMLTALTIRDFEVQNTIVTIEKRAKRNQLCSRTDTTAPIDQRRIETLRAENNFGSIMALFESLTTYDFVKYVPAWLFNNMMRSAALHSNLEAALLIFKQVEMHKDLSPSPQMYNYLISIFTDHGDLRGAEEVFNDFLRAAKEDKVDWGINDTVVLPWFLSTPTRPAGERVAQLQVWNAVIEAFFRCGTPERGVEVLARMMDSKVGADYSRTDIPPPAASTFTTVISGFIRSGDIDSALSWFDKLLQQDVTPRSPFEASLQTFKPDDDAWHLVLETLMEKRRIADLNKVFVILVDDRAREGMDKAMMYREMVLQTNIRYLEENQLDSEQASKIFDFIVSYVLLPPGMTQRYWLRSQRVIDQLPDFVQQCVRYGEVDRAVDVMQQWMSQRMEVLRSYSDADMSYILDSMRTALTAIAHLIFAVDGLSLRAALKMAKVCESFSLSTPETVIVSSYNSAVASGAPLELSLEEWEIVTDAMINVNAGQGDSQFTLERFFGDLASRQIDISAMSESIRKRLMEALSGPHDENRIRVMLQPWGEKIETAFAFPETGVALSSATVQAPRARADRRWSNHVGEFYPSHPKVTLDMAFSRFKEGVKTGMFPSTEVIGRLINALGRKGKLSQVNAVYSDVQQYLAFLEHDKQAQSEAWFHIEDSMVIAYAQAGLSEPAHVHRGRIIAHGGVPSADAYASLIQCVNETTDDAAHAMALFEEAQLGGVKANTYLYNTIISKLAKARKADLAIELFNQMKTMGHRATSVTYGAVIAACCRVGDASSAEELFQEMIAQNNFTPRVPPYNTMIQLYVHTKPNRDRALFYYNALLEARVQPSAHTYKLLLDAYGTIEPVDVPAMHRVFDRLVDDRSVTVTGAHWASLINSYGCVQKNLNKAVEIFDSIQDHRASARSAEALPDAVAYEALINVFVSLRKTDLIPAYIQRLQSSNVHLTAYIANLMIKGYASGGDIDRARAVFESLTDPPQGVAAPNNHTSHSPTKNALANGDTPVYREPSTWEAMVRAELGVGNRDRAVALLERLQTRHYPPAVYARISGIMLDDSVAPWSSDSSPRHSGSEADSH